MSQPNQTPADGSDRTDEPAEPNRTEPSQQTDQIQQTEDTRVIDTDQPDSGAGPTEQLPTDPAPTHAAPIHRGHPEPFPAEPFPGEPAVARRPSGPHLPAILLGLACLAIAGLALAQELGQLQVDWGNVGPLGIVAAGAVLVVLGLVGLLTSRRHDTH